MPDPVIQRALPIFGVILLSACSPSGLTASSPGAPTPSLQPLPTEIVAASEWIEVDVAAQAVLLHRDGAVVAQYPAATGLTTYAKYRTPAGVFDIQVKQKGPIENVPGVFVSDILIFDLEGGIGIHSRPMDAEGNLLDERLGLPITGGCVRVGESAQVYDFAKVGMWVWVH
jgi:L,D-transpeptidase catalytic domain